MWGREKNIYHLFIRLFFTGLVIFLIFNTVFFLHLHTLSDGSVVIHAHPYNDKPSGENEKTSHNHSFAEYLMVGVLNLVILFTGLALLFGCLNNASAIKFGFPKPAESNAFPYGLFSRGPPNIN